MRWPPRLTRRSGTPSYAGSLQRVGARSVNGSLSVNGALTSDGSLDLVGALHRLGSLSYNGALPLLRVSQKYRCSRVRRIAHIPRCPLCSWLTR